MFCDRRLSKRVCFAAIYLMTLRHLQPAKLMTRVQLPSPGPIF